MASHTRPPRRSLNRISRPGQAKAMPGPAKRLDLHKAADFSPHQRRGAATDFTAPNRDELNSCRCPNLDPPVHLAAIRAPRLRLPQAHAWPIPVKRPEQSRPRPVPSPRVDPPGILMMSGKRAFWRACARVRYYAKRRQQGIHDTRTGNFPSCSELPVGAFSFVNRTPAGLSMDSTQ